MPTIIDIVNGPWAIVPDRLIEIQGIYATHLRGEKISIPDIEAKLGRKLDNRYQGFQIRDGIAVIPVEGAIAKRMNLFSQISGGASTQLIQRDLELALSDPKVKGVVLSIDSPGGTVDGTFELADYIYQSRGSKPIFAFSDGMICSAAYAIGSATDGIYITGHTNTIGSIGVVAAHRDYSGYEKNWGVKTTEITAGKYKRISSQYEPLSDEGRADIQDKVDALYSVFVDAVARHRGISTEQVLADMADGRVFIGQQAVKNGLVDGVSTLDDLIDGILDGSISAGGQQQKGSKKASAGVAEITHEKESIMDKEKLKAEHPELYDALVAEGREQAAAEQGDAVQAAIAGEKSRILALAGACLGEDAAGRFATIVNAGLTVEQVSALGISVAAAPAAAASGDEASRQDILAALKSGGQDPVGKTGPEGDKDKDFEALVKEHQDEHQCKRTDALRAVAAAHPEAHAVYLRKQ